VVSTLAPVPGGRPGSGQVVLGSRTLIINSASSQAAANDPTFTLVDLDLAIQNTGDGPVANQPTFFELVGPEGDVFGHQDNSSDDFYGTVAARTTRSGTISFRVPSAARSGLRLLYRPEVATQTVIVSLRLN
jgi:hypothetical protein